MATLNILKPVRWPKNQFLRLRSPHSKKSGNLLHVYAKSNMLKLPDRRISHKGNYQYRLAIRYNQQFDNYMSYSVGHMKNVFFLSWRGMPNHQVHLESFYS